MSKWMKVSDDGTIEQVAWLDADTPEFLEKIYPGTWVDTDDSIAFRYAEIGNTYNPDSGGCYQPKPYASWTLDTSEMDWRAPVDYPEDGTYSWDEQAGDWVESTNNV